MARASRQETETATGRVRRLVADRGFGFIRGVNGQEYFFHRSASPGFDDLRLEQLVEFNPCDGPKGPRAENVSRVD